MSRARPSGVDTVCGLSSMRTSNCAVCQLLPGCLMVLLVSSHGQCPLLQHASSYSLQLSTQAALGRQ